MPELDELLPWDSASWDNMAAEWRSGTGHLDKRPYYFKVVGQGGSIKILLISAVPSKTQAGAMHATDYLRLNHEAYIKLKELGAQVFDKSSGG